MALSTFSCRRSRMLASVLLCSATVSAWAWEGGRMTGGGSIICSGPAYRVTFGYELHCQREGTPISGPNNLEVNFSTGEHFHLTSLTSAVCSGPDTGSPDAPFTTMIGSGTGTLNGSPATIDFKLVDNAEPGVGVDYARFTIRQGSTTVLQCGNKLEGGNNQAHRTTGNKP